MLLLSVPVLLAGAGVGFTPGVEGQAGFGAPVPSADGRFVALTAWDRAGLEVLDLQSGTLTSVTTARGAGFAPIWDGDALVFKAIGEGQEAWRWEAGRAERLDQGARVGQPALLAGELVWTHGDTLRTPTAELPGVGDVDLLAVSPQGDRLAWADDSGELHVRDLRTGRTTELGSGGGAYPAWSPDGALLAITGYDGTIQLLDPDRDVLLARAEGRHARWLPNRHAVVFDATVTTGDLGPESGRSPYEVVSASLRTLDADTGALTTVLDDAAVHPRYPAPLPDGSLLFVDSQDGSLWHLTDAGAALVLAGAEAPRRTAPPPSFGTTAVDVPYMHQLWDTPDDFDGGWSCGPTSCVQTMAKWSVLPNADITTSWPYAHTSHWGWYIPNNYTFNGYTYDTWGVAASSDCQGAHGFICREYGGAVWNYMVDFLNQHGVGSAWAGTSYDTVIAETNAGYPLVASATVIGYGHIIVIRGYLTSEGSPIHSFVVNDPYGNAGSGDWGNFDGGGVVYDWPGYDNGYLEISISQLFYAHGTAPVVETPPEEEEDPAPVDTGTATEDPPVTDTGTPTEAPPDSSRLIAHNPGAQVSFGELGSCSTAGAPWSAGLVLAGAWLATRRRSPSVG